MKFKTALFLLIFALYCFFGLSQVIPETLKKEILEEGLELYKLELASQQATEKILNTLSTKRRMEINDFLTYNSEGNYKSIFWKSIGKQSMIYETITFNKDMDINSLDHSSEERLPSSYEFLLIKIKEKVQNLMLSDPDFFKVKESDNYRYIFHLEDSKFMKVYIIATPEADENIYLGNDFLLTFKSNGKLIKKEKIHNKCIRLPASFEVDENSNIQGTKHTHAEGNSSLINPTDICLLLLNAHLVNWDKHYVLSDEYVSILNLRSKKLEVLPRSFFNE